MKSAVSAKAEVNACKTFCPVWARDIISLALVIYWASCLLARRDLLFPLSELKSQAVVHQAAAQIGWQISGEVAYHIAQQCTHHHSFFITTPTSIIRWALLFLMTKKPDSKVYSASGTSRISAR